MSGTLVLGYDVESAAESTAGFMAGAADLHEKYDIPWSIYLTGHTIDAQKDNIKPFIDHPLLTVGQHTYSHLLLKSVYMQPGDGKEIHGCFPSCFVKGGSLEQCTEEIARTQKIILDEIGIVCKGITGPYNYYRGLVDRPDLLQVLQDNGITFSRCNGRDFRDCQPTPLTEQPFFYTDQGFPDILELGIQGYQDDFYWERFDDRSHGETYQDWLYWMLEEISKKDLIFNLCSHDHGTKTKEEFYTHKAWLEDLIKRALDLGIRFAGPEDIYQEMKKEQVA